MSAFNGKNNKGAQKTQIWFKIKFKYAQTCRGRKPQTLCRPFNQSTVEINVRDFPTGNGFHLFICKTVSKRKFLNAMKRASNSGI